MVNEFTERVRKGEIAQPHQRKFTLASWGKKFKSVHTPSTFDIMVFQAGLVFYDLFNLARRDLGLTEKEYPAVSRKSKVRALCGLSNRNFCLTMADVVKDFNAMRSDEILLADNLRSLTNSNNLSGQEMLYTQANNMTIDSLQKALVSTLSAESDGQSKNPISMEHLQQEVALSNIYYVLEGMWESVLYGAACFKYKPSTKEIIISERESEHGYNFTIETMRDERINFIRINGLKSLGHNKDAMNFNRLCIQGSGKSKRIKIIVNKDPIHTESKLLFEYQTYLLSESVPTEILSKGIKGKGSSIYDILDVFKCLMHLAMDVTTKFPINTDISAAQGLSAFAKKIGVSSLSKSVSSVTGIGFKKVKEIVNFLTFEGDHKKDIWCHPLVKESDSSVYMLLSPFWSPTVLRLVESWLEFLKVDFSEKGHKYEEHVATSILECVDDNPLLDDVKICRSREFKFCDSKEEIDLIILFNNLIIVGEVKCSIRAENYRRYGQLMDKVAWGAEQVKRKAAFLQDNLKGCFKAIGWDYSELEEYKVQPIVICNSCFGTSRQADGIPIVDLRILKSYFSENLLPIISTDSVGGGHEGVVSMQLYSSHDEAVCNFQKYLNNLPQYSGLPSRTEFIEAELEINSEMYSRLIHEQCKQAKITEDVMQHDYEQDYPFPIIRGDLT